MSGRVFAASVGALLLGGCGFHPLYAKVDALGAPGESLAAIYVEPIPERIGYQLRNDLLDRLNGAADANGARYRLKLSLREQKDPVALRPNATITRYNYRLFAHYDLVPAGGAAAVRSGDVTSLTAYNVASSPYATVVAERDAADRAASDVAERLRTELAVYFRESAGAP